MAIFYWENKININNITIKNIIINKIIYKIKAWYVCRKDGF